jgi:hypothetical protein
MKGLITNHEWTRMNTNSEKLLLKDEVFQIVGCAIEVLNTLGHGLVEKPYENALGWRHPQLQAPEIRVGEDCLMKFVSIRVHSWLTA